MPVAKARAKKKAVSSRKIVVPKKTSSTYCGVPLEVIAEYGICEVACMPSHKNKCEYGKKEVF